MAYSIPNSQDETKTILDSSEDKQLESKTKDDYILLKLLNVINFRIRMKLSKMLATLPSSEEINALLLDNKSLRKYTNTVDLTKTINTIFKLYKLLIREAVVQIANEYKSLKNLGKLLIAKLLGIAYLFIRMTIPNIPQAKTIIVNNNGLSEGSKFYSLKKFTEWQHMLAYIVEQKNKNPISEHYVSNLEEERKENKSKIKRRKIIQSPWETESLMDYHRKIFGVQDKNSEENGYDSLASFLTNSREPLTSGSLGIALSLIQRKQKGIFALINYSGRPKFRVHMNEITSSMFESAMNGMFVDSNETEYITIHMDDCRMFLQFPVYKGGAMHRHEENLNNKQYSRND